MKKQKHFKFKRLILRIVSVISIISFLISSVVLSVSADSGSFSIKYPNYSVRLLQLYRGSTVGSIGTQIYNGFKFYDDDNLVTLGWSDTDGTKDIGGLTVRVELQFSRNFTYSQGQDLSVILPFKFNLYHPDVAVNYSSPAYIDVLNLSFVNRSSSGSVFDIYYSSTDQSVLSDGNIDIQYNATARKDFTFNCISFYFKVNSVPNSYTPKIEVVTFSITDSILLNFSPVFITPDFSDQDNNQALEDGIRENGSDAFAQLNNFYESLGHLGESFDFIKTSMFKSTFIFSTLFTDGDLLTDILYFALVIGLSGFIIGAIGSVAGWATSLGGREFGHSRNIKESEIRYDHYRRNRRR